MLPSTVSMRCANGRAASAACCARRNLDAATICIALVIFCVALVEAMRTRMSLSEAIRFPFSSCPALCRASTSSFSVFHVQDVDGRDEPGHDGVLCKALRIRIHRGLQLG